MVELPVVRLNNLAGGAPEELFEHAHRKIMESIEDPNVPWKGTRRITLKFDFAVNEARDQGTVAVTCDIKVPGAKPIATPVYINRHRGQTVMVEPLRQEDMFDQPIGRPEAVVAGRRSTEEDQP